MKRLLLLAAAVLARSFAENHRMFRLAIILFALGLTSASGSATLVVPGEEHCVVNVASWDRLNIRNEPSSHAQVVVRKRYGSCGISVVGKCRAQWCPVEDGHSVGWAHRRYLSMVSPAMYCTKVITPKRVSVRAYPSSNSRVLVALKPNTCDIAFLPYNLRSWQKIRVRGWEGWINRTFLSGQ